MADGGDKGHEGGRGGGYTKALRLATISHSIRASYRSVVWSERHIQVGGGPLGGTGLTGNAGRVLVLS